MIVVCVPSFSRMNRPWLRRLLVLAITFMLPHRLPAQDVNSVQQVADREGTTETERRVSAAFVITDEQGETIPQGTLDVHGHYDNNDFFEQDIPVTNGQARLELNRPLMRELSIQIEVPGYQHFYWRKVVQGIERGFPVKQSYAFQLRKGVTIGGKVVDEQGQPLRDVYVGVSSYSGGNVQEDGRHGHSEWLYTDEEGKWAVSGVPPDFRKLQLSFGHVTHVLEKAGQTGFARFRSVPARKDKGLLKQSDVRIMREAKPLVGKVVDPQGQPIRDVVVDITGRDSDWEREISRGLVIFTGEKGEFRLPQPPYGDQQLILKHASRAPQYFPVKIPTNEPVTVMMTPLLSGNERVEFRVVDLEGDPIVSAEVRPVADGVQLPFEGLTDGDGRLVWEEAPKQALEYTVRRKGYLYNKQFKTGPEDSPVTVTMRPQVPVHATVVDAETGDLVNEFGLYRGTHNKSNPPEYWSWFQQQTYSFRPVKGTWEIDPRAVHEGAPVEPGRFVDKLASANDLVQYRVQADGYLPGFSQVLDAEILPSEEVKLEFRLQNNGGLRRRVLRPDGKPASDAQVATQVKRGNGYSALQIVNGSAEESDTNGPAVVVQSDEHGQFTLPVHNDPFVCVITHPDGFLEVSDRELIEKETLTLNRWAGIAGSISVAEQPGIDLQLRLTWDDVYAVGLNDMSEVPMVLYSLTEELNPGQTYDLPYGRAGDWRLLVSYGAPSQEEIEHAGGQHFSPRSSSVFPVQLKEGETVEMDVGHQTVDIIGRFVAPQGVEVDWRFSGVHFIRELARTPDGRHRRWENYQATTKPDGSFRCFNMRPGDYEGMAIAGREEDQLRNFGRVSTLRKRGFELTVPLNTEMFDGKSSEDPIDLGNIIVQPVDVSN